MNTPKKCWIWLDNKKSAIAALYWAVVASPIPAELFDGEVPHSLEKWLNIIGWTLTAIGLGHKGFKAAGKDSGK